jgi:hypothetical protein
MRRTLALCAAAIALLRATPAAADPMDLDLVKLGAPAPSVWSALSAFCAANPTLCSANTSGLSSEALAFGSMQRYRQLVMQLGLGLSSPLLSDATTGGQLGLGVTLEAAGATIRHSDAARNNPLGGPDLLTWPVRGDDPKMLRSYALHVQKALPFSIDLGGRIIYLDQSQMAAAQAEIRWAINENYGSYLPDVAVRAAYTRLFGQRDLELNVIEGDLTVGKRFGVGGVVRLTPYGAVRLAAVGAKTGPIDFGPTAVSCSTNPVRTCFPDVRTPAQVLATTVPFPDMKFWDNWIYRLTMGGRMTAGAFSLGLELTYQPGKLLKKTEGLPPVSLPESWSGALRLGLEI